MKEILTEGAFRKLIEKQPVGGYLFFGDEDYLKAHALRTAIDACCPDKSMAVFNEMSVDPSADNFSELLASAVAAAPMMAETKAVTVTGLSVNDLKASELDAICSVAQSLGEFDYNLLIISVPAGMIDVGYSLQKPSATLAKLGEHLTPVHFPKVSEAKLASWIIRHFEHNGLKVETGVPAAMLERCGTDMYALANEIEKLSWYALSQKRDAVTLSDVPNITCQNEDYESFALGNAVAERNVEKALDILGVMKARKIEPVIIMGELSRTLGDMLAVKILIQNRKSRAEIASAIKLHEYKVKLAEQNVRLVSVEELSAAVDACARADSALKLSPNGYIEIEKLICSL